MLITQHMPATFAAILAEHLARLSGQPAREAKDGGEINAGHIYVAPGGRHMKVARRDTGTTVIALDNGPVINFCKPSVGPLFVSAAEVWGYKVPPAATITLAHVMAQDEATSVAPPGHLGAIEAIGAHAGESGLICGVFLPVPGRALPRDASFGLRPFARCGPSGHDTLWAPAATLRSGPDGLTVAHLRHYSSHCINLGSP